MTIYLIRHGQALAGLWQSVVTWFQGVDWAGLGRGLVEKLLGSMAANTFFVSASLFRETINEIRLNES